MSSIFSFLSPIFAYGTSSSTNTDYVRELEQYIKTQQYETMTQPQYEMLAGTSKKIRIGGINVDPNNVSGKTLAEIGRYALTGKEMVDKQVDKEYNPFGKEGDYTAIGWLDMRIDEICRKGKL